MQGVFKPLTVIIGVERTDERANLVEILSLEAPPSRAVAITLRLVQVTTVSLINDSQLVETGSLC